MSRAEYKLKFYNVFYLIANATYPRKYLFSRLSLIIGIDSLLPSRIFKYNQVSHINDLSVLSRAECYQ